MTGRLAIDDVQPSIDGGRYPTKAVVGEVVPVSAVVWREGHDAIAATLAVRGPADDPESAGRLVRIPMVPGTEPDTFHATFSPTSVGAWTYRVEAWSDPVATWRHAVTAKTDAGQDAAELANDLEVGARIFEKAAKGAPRGNRPALLAVAASLRSDRPLAERIAPAFAPDVTEILRAHPLRELITRGKAFTAFADRRRALFGSWYEFFPRSTGGWYEDGTPRHGTFATAAADLPRIAAMGFDVVYLPDPSDRQGQPQGTEQHPRRRPGRRRVALGDRFRRGRPRRHPPRTRHRAGLPRFRRPREGTRARGRPRSRPAVRPRPPVGA